MIISQYLSNKLKLLTFLSGILVIITHAYKEEIILKINNEEYFFFELSRFLSIGVGRITIPIFFIISGFFFYKNFKFFSIEEYKLKLKKRLHTLLIPYLIVSALGILIAYLISINNLNETYSYGSDLKNYSFINILKVWLIKPEAYHLWFIRNLIILSLISPIILYFLTRKKSSEYLTVFFTIWLMLSNILPSPTSSILFFSIGGFIVVKNIQIPICRNVYYAITCLILWFISIYISLFSSIELPKEFENLLMNISIILGIIAVWISYDLISSAKWLNKLIISKLIGFTFFIYLFHEPLITLIIETTYKLDTSPFIHSVIYLLSPIITIFICYYCGCFFKKYIPKLYNIIAGGRI